MSPFPKILITLVLLVIGFLIAIRKMPGLTPPLRRLRASSLFAYYLAVFGGYAAVIALIYFTASQKVAIFLTLVIALYLIGRHAIPALLRALRRLKEANPAAHWVVVRAFFIFGAGVVGLPFTGTLLNFLLFAAAAGFALAALLRWLAPGVGAFKRAQPGLYKGIVWTILILVVVLLGVFMSAKAPVAFAIIAMGYLLTMKGIPWVAVKVGRALGFRMQVTPLTERRIQRFRRIQRGYVSFVIISTALVLSLFLELYVNKLPLYIHFDGEQYEDENKNGEWDHGEAFTDANGNGAYDVAEAYTDQNDNAAWDDGEEFEDANENGKWDAAEAFVDATGNGEWDEFEPSEPFTDLNANGRLDGGKTLYPAVADWLAWVPFLDLEEYTRAVSADFGLKGQKDVPFRSYARWADDPAEMERDAKKLEQGIVEDEKKFRKAMAAAAAAKGDTYDMESPLQPFKVAQYKEDTEKAAALRRLRGAFEKGRISIVSALHPYSPDEQLFELEGMSPHAAFQGDPNIPVLGTDFEWKEVLSQLLYGFRISFLFAIVVAFIGFSIGISVGAIMGYFGGWTDIIVQRVIEVWSSIPFLFTLMILGSIYTPSFLMLAVLLVLLRAWLGITYTMRGEYYREKARDYVQAARALGVRRPKIMARHIFPNALVPVVTFMPFAIVAYIGTLVSLDYLGFGLGADTPSWGTLLRQGGENIRNNQQLVMFPIVAFAATLFCVVMIGEAVREAFDPKLYSRLR